jgi:hypothetical protein
MFNGSTATRSPQLAARHISLLSVAYPTFSMRMRWRPVLCLWGVIVFAFLTYGSIRTNRDLYHNHRSRYFWWGSVRLDSDPLNRYSIAKPCTWKFKGDCGWDPGYIRVRPGIFERALFASALPAFVAAIAVARGLARVGVSELLSFMVAMPVLTVAWFCVIGWVLDRWWYRRVLRRAFSPQHE